LLKIAVCDDNAAELERTTALLNTFFDQRPEMTADVSLFEDAQSLLTALKKGSDFDLYLLDVLMPELNGIEAGKAIRDLGRTGAIIYLTTSPDYAVDSYLTQAFFYLLKPVDQEQLFQVLDRAVSVLQERKSAATVVATHTGARSIPLDDILFAERVDRCVHYYLADGEVVTSRTIRGTFRDAAADLLSDGRFAMCGASFLLGLHHVKSVERTGALLDTGKTVPVSRAAFADLKRAWMNYWLGGDPEA